MEANADHKPAQPLGVASTEGLGLVPCPLCGASEGYKLDEGSTYRWWSVRCAGCGQEVSEARATYPAETTARTESADTEWNNSGAHAQGLRDEIERLRGVLERAATDIVRADMERAQIVAAERERCATAVRNAAEGYRGTRWGKASECIGDACIAAIRGA